MLASRSRFFKLFGIVSVALSITAPSYPQSIRGLALGPEGVWHLRSHIPLGTEALLLQPSHRVVQLLATAEDPVFAGWTVRVKNSRAALLDNSGQAVQILPRSVTFRVTASARERLADSDPIAFDCSQRVEDFLLGLHFSLQIFRGMQMRTVQATRQWMIGVPADEYSDERVYRASFDIGDVHPDDRIVLLVTDDSGRRVTKFHLEFL